MLKGRCPGCEEIYYGWALQNEDHQWCECGDILEIITEGENTEEEGKPCSI